MATHNVDVLPYMITAEGTAVSTVNIRNPLVKAHVQPVIFVEVISGTFKFSVGGNPNDSSAEITSSDGKIPITLQYNKFKSDDKQLKYVADASSGGTFKIYF